MIRSIVATALVAASVPLAGAYAGGDNHPPAPHGEYGKGHHRAFICHGTGSKTNPFVLIKVPRNSAHFVKHLPEGRDVLPTKVWWHHKKKFKCKMKPVPTPTPTPTPTVTPTPTPTPPPPPPTPTPTPTPPAPTPTPTPPVATPTPTPTPTPPPTKPPSKPPRKITVKLHHKVPFFNLDPRPEPAQIAQARRHCLRITVKRPGITHGIQTWRARNRCNGRVLWSTSRWYIGKHLRWNGRTYVGGKFVNKHRAHFRVFTWARGRTLKSYLFDPKYWTRPAAYGQYEVGVVVRQRRTVR